MNGFRQVNNSSKSKRIRLPSAKMVAGITGRRYDVIARTFDKRFKNQTPRITKSETVASNVTMKRAKEVQIEYRKKGFGRIDIFEIRSVVPTEFGTTTTNSVVTKENYEQDEDGNVFYSPIIEKGKKTKTTWDSIPDRTVAIPMEKKEKKATKRKVAKREVLEFTTKNFVPSFNSDSEISFVDDRANEAFARRSRANKIIPYVEKYGGPISEAQEKYERFLNGTDPSPRVSTHFRSGMTGQSFGNGVREIRTIK
jgi:hypothetical protein